MIDRPLPRPETDDGAPPAEERPVLLLVARHDPHAPPVSLLNQVDIALRRLRGTIEQGRFLLPWAVGASLLAVVLLVERQREPPPSAPVVMMSDRPPPVARPAPVDLAPPLPPGLAGSPPPLVGIVGRLPDDAVALVRKPDGRTRTMRVGALFDGWTLASLDSDEAVFDRRGQRVTVALPPPEDQ